MNVQAANKIAAEIAAVNAELELFDLKEELSSEEYARAEMLIETERQLREALRDARANNSTGHTARLISENRD